ncbi:MAG: PAS domain-containing protein [Verrucomicrobia bacterium]|nr:PAS domain-containing protein [Verrucomicrobiota bacterium]
MKSGFLDKLIDRLDKLDPGSLQTHFLQLASDKGLLETIFHAIQEGIIVLDGEGDITYANRAAEKLLGFRLESAAGDSISRYLRDIDWELVLDLDEGEWSRMVSREIEVNYPEHRFLAFYVVPLSLVREEESGAVLILRDITRDREHGEKVIESERLHALTLLAGGVAHEIGNPLNSLNIHLQLLDREIAHLADGDRENLGELVDVASQEVKRLNQIINQFLRAIRPVEPELEQTDLADLLGETLRFMRHEIEDKSVLVEKESPDDLPPIKVDKAQIKQVFFNIIKNGLQAMTGGGLLKITISATERFIAVAFRDSGSGIEPESLGQIFDAYHTTKGEGSGLGLMIVQRIIRDHGGEIEVDSEPGRGTTFTIFLPPCL